jgi:hypothetical protein
MILTNNYEMKICVPVYCYSVRKESPFTLHSNTSVSSAESVSTHDEISPIIENIGGYSCDN